MPLNVALSKNLVNLDNLTLIGPNKVIGLREAYQKGFAFTVQDIDQSSSSKKRRNEVQLSVHLARKSTTGKAMSARSALAKNWLSIDRRVYIDKQNNQEYTFAQAIDMDLLVLRHDPQNEIRYSLTSLNNNIYNPYNVYNNNNLQMNRSKSTQFK